MSNKKVLATLLLAFVFLVFRADSAKAGLISITDEGKVMVKVLSAQSWELLTKENGGGVDVSKVQGVRMADPSVSLEEKDGRYSMQILSEGTYRELDITGISQDVVEIEERPEVNPLTISLSEDGFDLKQGSFVVKTSLPIEIDAKTARLSLVTVSGKEFLSVLPVEAVESALRSGIVSRITNNSINMDDGGGVLSYRVQGEKVFDVFNIREYSFPVSVNVSAKNGHIVSIDSPSPIYKVLRAFFI